VTTPLLLVSGWAHPAEALQPLAEQLGRRHSVRVFAIHELADRSGRSDRSDYAAGLIRELEREKKPCVLAGWSMGGMIALEAAATSTRHVAALILISSAPRLAAAPDFPQGVPPRVLRSMTLSFRRGPERTLSEFFINAAFPHPLPPPLLQEKLAAAMAIGTDRLAEQLRYLTESDLRKVARRLTTPVLVLHGSLDRIIPVGTAAWMKAPCPGVQMREWPDGGHSLPLQQPGRIAGPILRFLEGSG
jgi:pimeloyl-ACP methyl ester carboxylesterase